MIIALKEARTKQHYSCQAMANKLGICKTFYWQIENGKRRITYPMAINIANILNSTTDQLFYDYYLEKLNLKR